jgi:hypothetical protein
MEDPIGHTHFRQIARDLLYEKETLDEYFSTLL